ncbi:MAG: hypothetical protein WC352_07870 [Candidatus Omnitrophota bacterium]|jgi:hypothetical protein
MKRFPLVVLLAIVFLPAFLANPHSFVFASSLDNFQTSPWVKKQPYAEKTIQKLGFGLTNGLSGWTALLFEPCRASNPLTGLAKGAWRSIFYTAGGALHAVTFPVPIDVPLPDGGVHFD